MNKFVKMTGISLVIAGSLAMLGCGDEKKPEAKKPATTTTKPATTQKQTTPAAKLPEGAHWRYPSYIKNAADTPKVTPEIQKVVDECFAQCKLQAAENGKFLNDSKISASDQRPIRDLWFHADGANHDTKYNKNIKNSKGKMVSAQEVFHIRMQVDKNTSAIKNWSFYKYVVNAENPDGKKIMIKEVK